MKAPITVCLPILLAMGAMASFRDTCKFKTFDPTNDGQPTLYYECPLENPKAWPFVSCSKIHLNDCFVNVVGKLWNRENGAFGGSCKECSYNHDSGDLKCSCDNGGGVYKKTTINVDEAIQFIDKSKLGCYGIAPEINCGPSAKMRL